MGDFSRCVHAIWPHSARVPIPQNSKPKKNRKRQNKRNGSRAAVFLFSRRDWLLLYITPHICREGHPSGIIVTKALDVGWLGCFCRHPKKNRTGAYGQGPF